MPYFETSILVPFLYLPLLSPYCCNPFLSELLQPQQFPVLMLSQSSQCSSTWCSSLWSCTTATQFILIGLAPIDSLAPRCIIQTDHIYTPIPTHTYAFPHTHLFPHTHTHAFPHVISVIPSHFNSSRPHHVHLYITIRTLSSISLILQMPQPSHDAPTIQQVQLTPHNLSQPVIDLTIPTSPPDALHNHNNPSLQPHLTPCQPTPTSPEPPAARLEARSVAGH